MNDLWEGAKIGIVLGIILGLLSGCSSLDCTYSDNTISFKGARWLRSYEASETKGDTTRTFKSSPQLFPDIPDLIVK